MRILYVMHVNWRWIRQRPHVIAEGLAQHHALTLIDVAMYRANHRVNERSPSFDHITLWRIPERILRIGAPFERLNRKLLATQLQHAVNQTRPDLVWLTHPVFAHAFSALGHVRLVYDCMDDHLEFREQASSDLAENERWLVGAADLTFYSSRTLMERVQARSHGGRGLVVHNGVASSLVAREPLADRKREGANASLTFGYFGTISHWFDWGLIDSLLLAYPQARLVLAGPVESSIPAHGRIHHVGTLAHDQLRSFSQDCDVLLMPFRVNRLIEAVDPVKLYEYVAFGRPCLAPRYAETVRFEPWVTLYDSAEDAVLRMQQLSAGPKADIDVEGRRAFLALNTWDVRIKAIESAVGSIGTRQ